MPRIRTVKPEFWADEKLSLLDPLTRLVFLGLICMADDAGRLVDNVKLLDGMIFPNTDDSCREALGTLARLGRIVRYWSPSDQALIQIANWSEHQRVDNPAKYNLPGPRETLDRPSIDPREDVDRESEAVPQPAVPSAVNGTIDSSSRDPSENQSRVSRSDLLPTTPDLRPTTNDQRPTTSDRQVSEAATRLSVRANQGLTEHEKPSRRQLVPSIIASDDRTHEAARKILEAGVPLAFAESAVYDIARTHNATGAIKTLKYFVNGVVRAHEEHIAAEQAASTPRLATNGSGRSKGVRVVDHDAQFIADCERLAAEERAKEAANV